MGKEASRRSRTAFTASNEAFSVDGPGTRIDLYRLDRTRWYRRDRIGLWGDDCGPSNWPPTAPLHMSTPSRHALNLPAADAAET